MHFIESVLGHDSSKCPQSLSHHIRSKVNMTNRMGPKNFSSYFRLNCQQVWVSLWSRTPLSLKSLFLASVSTPISNCLWHILLCPFQWLLCFWRKWLSERVLVYEQSSTPKPLCITKACTWIIEILSLRWLRTLTVGCIMYGRWGVHEVLWTYASNSIH